MAKKRKQTASGPDVFASAHTIWLAGLGALAAAEREGAKVFKSLVQLGEKYDADLRGEVGKASSRFKDEADKARSRAETTWKKIETGVSDQVSSALHRLNVPTKSEIAGLRRKVEQLTRSRDEMQPGGRKKKTTRKKAAPKKKAAAKKKTGRKKAARKT
jgi:poly(hydroxyalkanoate) granule-associated protein